MPVGERGFRSDASLFDRRFRGTILLHPEREVLQQLIVGHALNFAGIDDDMPSPVFESLALTRFEELIPTDNERAREIDRAVAEAGREIIALLGVAQFPKPVNDLTVPVIEFGRPFAGALLPLPAEQTLWTGLLELDKVERLRHRIADDKIATEVAKKVVLESNPVAAVDIGMVRSDNGGQVVTFLEEGENLLASVNVLFAASRFRSLSTSSRHILRSQASDRNDFMSG